MQAIKCELCGSNQLIKNDGFYQCEYCGTKYTLEEARKLIVSGTVEVVTGNAEKERLLKNAETYISINEFERAITLYDKIIEQFPDDYRGWWGSFTTIINQYFHNNKFNQMQTINKQYENAYSLCEDKSIFVSFFNRIITLYGNQVHTIDCNNMIYYDSNLKEITGTLKVIDSFSCWIIFYAYNIFDILPDSFKSFVKQINEDYLTELSVGNICPEVMEPLSIYQSPPLYNGEWVLKMDSYNLQSLAVILHNKFGYKIKFGRSYFADNKYLDHIIICYYSRWISEVQGISVCVSGRWAMLRFNDTLRWWHLPNTLTQKDVNKCLGLCQHCGGTFKGIFNITCSKCGKPKDY